MSRKNPSPSRSIRVRATLCALVILAAVVSLSPAFMRLNALAQGDGAADDPGGIHPLAEFVRAVSLPVSDVIYNPADQTLYASVPSSAGAAGNSIVPINPATGATGAPVFVGSEPNKLALSDDGHTLYVALDGSYNVRRFDTATRTSGLQFSITQDSLYGNYTANDLAVAPGNPNLLAVARYNPGSSPPGVGVAVYDNGVQRPKIGPGHIEGADFLAFSATASKLYGGGYYHGLRTMIIDATGVASQSKTTFDVRARIKFANGIIYSSGGQVVNPETSTLLGTFSGVSTNAFAVDTAAGRAYYLGRDNFGSGSLTLKAFDLSTYVPAGSATLTGIVGEPTTMVRWGANGLAFRTDAGRLYLIQTSLIPSSEAIPSPTPFVSPTATPTPPPAPTFVRQIPLLTNDLIYSAQTQQLYASVPSAAGAKGNSITRLDPETGEIGTSLFVGSEPTRLALADDGQTMYVGLNGAAAVRKLDVSAQTAGIQFTLGTSNYDGAYLPDDIAVMPGSPGTVAVSKLNGGTTIYDAGVARTQSSTTGGSIEFGSPTRLYAGSNPVQKQSVDANGITNLAYFNTGSFGRTQYAGGLLYLSGGGVIDPETGVIKGRFTGLDYENVMAIDTAKNRAFFLTNNFSSGWNLRAFELDTFRLMGVVRVQGISSGPGLAPSSLVRWGKNGLAFRAYDRIFLIQTTLVDSTETVPAATPTPSPTPASSPVYIPTVVNKVNLPANDLVIDVGTQTLYASVPSSGGGAVGNSITSVDPKTGAIGASTFVGSEPNKLAISDDGQVLYVNLDGAKAVRRFDIATKTPGTQFAVGVDRPADMEVVPGSPQSLAVSRGTGGFSSSNSGVAVYDNGVQRPNTSNGGAYAIGPIEFGATPTRLYGYDSYSSGFELVKFSLDASGVNLVSLTRNLLSGYDHGLKFAGGRLYSSGGRVVDPEAMTLLGRFHSGGAAFVVDQTLGRAFFLSTNNGSNSGLVLSAYDINTFLPLGSVTLTGVFNTPVGLVRWGKNGLAFTTLPNSFNSTAEASQIYLVQSALVSDAEPIASVIQFSAATYNAFEGTGSTNGLITVLRTGSVTGAATVNYTTGGGTATPGSDYTATSGTLSFAEGETMKTFTVPITDDLVYEGAVRETIELTLSAPTGATLGSQKTAAINIQDNESRPYIVVNTLSVPEGQSGTTNAQFVVRLSNPSVETISVSYATADGTAQAESDYVAASGTLVFQPGEMEKSIPLQIKGDTVDEGNETFVINFSNPVNLNLYNTNGSVIIVADERPLIQFGAPEFTANEGDGRITVVVTRFGPTTDTATVNYSTLDDSRSIRCDDNISNNRVAFARCDYMTTFDTLVFAPGESEKTFTVPLVDDGHDEPREFIQVRLTTPVGATLGTPSTATLNFEDNDEPNQPNPIDTHGFFVRQHYLDFLSREPEADGLAAWTGVLNGCPDAFDGDAASPSAQCDRKLVSSSFFRSIEFELKGYFVYRFYRAAYNRRPSYTEFVGDMRRVTGQTAEDVYARRRAFGDAWVLRQEFVNRYGALTNAAYVDALLVRYGLTAINTTDPAAPDGDALVRLTRDDLVAALDAQHMTKAQVLRAIVQSREVDAAEYNGAFVAMQYYGYLRRAPEQSGYDAWLQVITRGDGYRVMVNGFMNSAEYRLRFGR